MSCLNETLTSLFCIVDDFSLEFEPEWRKRLIDNRQRKRKSTMSLSEVMTIVIHFHQSGYRTFKHYYNVYVKCYLKEFFPRSVSYGRFVELMKGSVFPTFCFLQGLMGQCTGISIIDSTPLTVCNNRRINSNKVFKNIAKRGKSSTGWFFGFKLHLVINDQGELLAWMLKTGNIDDRKPVKKLCEDIQGLLVGDKGYLSSKLFKELYSIGLKLITKIKAKMKNVLLDIFEKFLLKKRSVIECVNQHLKETCQIEHTRHRSKTNFILNLMSGLSAYCLSSLKPSLGLRKKYKILIMN